MGTDSACGFDAQGQPDDRDARFVFRRGWLWNFEVKCYGKFDPSQSSDRAWRWLHTLKLDSCENSFAAATFLENLRSLQIGYDETRSESFPDDLVQTVAAATRLERLYLTCFGQEDTVLGTAEIFRAALNRLRELHFHCETQYATHALAENPAFAGLHTLAFHPHAYTVLRLETDSSAYLTAANVRDIAYSPYLKRLENLQLNCLNAGDEGIDILVNSGLIHRLRSLDLRHGCVTDAGALTLVKALDGTPHALQVLKLGDNALTGDGVAALRRLKLTLDAPDQHAPGDDNYLTQGDFE